VRSTFCNKSVKRAELEKHAGWRCASFTLDEFVGALAPPGGLTLYRARVGPILTFGCEVVLDVEEASVAKLIDSSDGYWPRSWLSVCAGRAVY
jgi:hypothetical protein